MKENLLVRIVKSFPRKIKRALLGHIEFNNAKANLLLKLLTEKDAGVRFMGQADQDLLAYLYFQGQRDGFYLDIGANDGITMSNTYIFEKIGWKGICVEPQPDIFSLLKKNRSCDCYNTAITGSAAGEMEFIKVTGVLWGGGVSLDGLSGLNDPMTRAHKKRITREKGNIEIIKVKTSTFDDLMKHYPGRAFIDFMSIDVEGAEMDILKSIDFKKYHFGLMTIENNEERRGDGAKLKAFMRERGYKVFFDLGLDIVFAPL